MSAIKKVSWTFLFCNAPQMGSPGPMRPILLAQHQNFEGFSMGIRQKEINIIRENLDKKSLFS